MKKISRRGFLKGVAAAGATFPLVTIAGTKASGRVLGANDVIRVGVAGIHGQGNAHIDQYLGLKYVQVTYLIDPDSRLFDSRRQIVPLLKIHVDDMIPAHRAVERDRSAVDVNSPQYRNFTGQGNNVSGNLLKILQFAGK